MERHIRMVTDAVMCKLRVRQHIPQHHHQRTGVSKPANRAPRPRPFGSG